LEGLDGDSQFSYRMTIYPLMDYLKAETGFLLLGIWKRETSWIHEKSTDWPSMMLFNSPFTKRGHYRPKSKPFRLNLDRIWTQFVVVPILFEDRNQPETI